MIDYDRIACLVEDSVKGKQGLEFCIPDIAGCLCEGIRQQIFKAYDVDEYFKILKDVDVSNIPADHKWHRLVDMLPVEMQINRVTLYLEKRLTSYNGGRKAQIGPGEFILCWYALLSVLQSDNQKSGDIILAMLIKELKKINGNNDTSPELFDYYIGRIDRLVGVYAINEKSLNPKIRTQFISCDPANWKEVFYHKLNKNAKPGDKRAWNLNTYESPISGGLNAA